ncbi:PREDICTED: uncharacterized protein LOC108747886 [Trachymyrmex septentrionalis]|uniref:uncharacterized protein LOC108747886 n=1 Tax=Trachymyrmex septentrionalis TaxID=34720 RepID=UPI00084F785E|nr:PREDICTED: uncharacterized protein LOC108747886 [Trachymyrmex septentrionalis]
MWSALHSCDRNNLNYDQCIKDNINNIRDEIFIFDGPGIKLYLEKVKSYTFCDFVINSIHADLDKLQFNFDIAYNLNVTSSYVLDVHLLVPIVHKGKCQILTSM